MGEVGEKHHTKHENGGSDELDLTGLSGSATIEDTAVDGHTTVGISSNWAFDHAADATKHIPGFVDRGDPAAYD